MSYELICERCDKWFKHSEGVELETSDHKYAIVLCKACSDDLIEWINAGIKLSESPKGRWITHEDYHPNLRYGCNICGSLNKERAQYCPNCKSEMEVEP